MEVVCLRILVAAVLVVLVTSKHVRQRTNATDPMLSCNKLLCRLPKCFCYGDRPNTISVDQQPQFIMLTFDDRVDQQLYDDYYRDFFVDNIYNVKNPNGCSTKSTFYVLDEWTDYDLVVNLWKAGNEIGDHTVTHELPEGNKQSDYDGMVAEIEGMKDRLYAATKDQELVDEIIGFRAPYLRVAGNVQFDVLRDYGFWYDTSILNIEIMDGRDPMWPFTLDYVIPFCPNPPCPTKSYAGLWEVPLNGWIGDDGNDCSMADSCVVGSNSFTATKEQWYKYFKRNFEDYFLPKKIPFPIFIHATMFSEYPNSFDALFDFLRDTIKSSDNIWLVTPTQVIEWMKDQKPNDQMIRDKWGCWI